MALAALLVTTGCGGGDPQPVDSTGEVAAGGSASVDPSETAPSPTEEVPDLTTEQIETYLSDMFSELPKRVVKAQKSAVPDSVADRYAQYRLAIANSNLDGGYPQDARDVAVGSEEAEVCTADGKNCSTFANFQGEDGRVASFTVDGKKIDGRLVAGSGKTQPVAGVGTVEFLAAYQAASDDTLVVAVRVEAGPGGLGVLDSFYRAKDGRQTVGTNISGPQDLGPDSSATYSMAFPNAKPGGDASLRVFVNNGAPTPLTVAVR